MSWNRRVGKLEELMILALKASKKPLSLLQIVEKIIELKPEVFIGKTPKNSLYSIIYRNENKRIKAGMPTYFIKVEKSREYIYSINPDNKDIK